MVRRRYEQYCGLAKALDVVGERWTLLVVRELLLGPRRYGELLEALEGIGTNLLAQRLKDLVAAGVVRKDGAYALTELGRALEEPVLGLARWGLAHATEPAAGEQTSAGWTMLGIRALVRPEDTAGIRERVAFVIDGATFHMLIDDGQVRVGPGPVDGATLEVAADSPTFVAIGSGQLTPVEAIDAGRLALRGDPAVLLALAKAMGMPV